MTQFWTLEDFTNEMDHLQKLSSIRPDSPCVAAMCQTFCAKLAAVTTWTSEAIVKLLEAAEKLTCQDALKLEIVKTIENLSCNPGSHMKLQNCGQTVESSCPYLTQGDWTMLLADKPLHDHLHLLSKRLVAMGVCNLKESTKQQAVALALFSQHRLAKPPMSPQMAHAMLADFTAIHKAMPRSSTPACRTYPINPHLLGDVWLQQAYGQERPEGKEENLAIFMKQVHCCPERNSLSHWLGKLV